VEEEMQRMVPALDDLKRKRIFNDDELRQIVKRRRNFEYLLQRPVCGTEDYLKYVRYEVALECLRKRKSDALRWRKKTESDYAGVARIHTIFKRACFRFNSDKRLWYQRIDFCLRSGSTTALAKVLAKAVKLHPKEDGFWLLAADRELKLGHIQAARTLLLRSLRCSPHSWKLWLEFLRLEVQVARRLEARRLRKAQLEAEESGGSPQAVQEDSWAPVRVLFKRALAQLDKNPASCAAFLRKSVCVISGGGKHEVTEHFSSCVKEVDAALQSRRSEGIALPSSCQDPDYTEEAGASATPSMNPADIVRILQVGETHPSAPSNKSQDAEAEPEVSCSEEHILRMLDRLTPGTSARPVFEVILMDSLAQGSRPTDVCDSLLRATAKRWDVARLHADALLAVLDFELLVFSPGAAAEMSGWRVGAQRVCEHFEDLLRTLPKEDPDQVECWARYVEFAQRLASHPSWAEAPHVADLQWRAMRSVSNQSAFQSRVRQLLQ